MPGPTQLRPADRAWIDTNVPGVERALLALPSERDPSETTLWRLAPGASAPLHAAGAISEILVVEGSWILEGTSLDAGSYSRRSGLAESTAGEGGCMLFAKRAPAGATAEDHLVPAAERAWVQGQGNLRVKPLHSAGTTGAAFVHWPPGERFVPHKHWGGEEIFVLSGTFMDEHGSYSEGTWLQSPHLSQHCPFVEEETVIFVKTGHLAR